MICKSLVVSGKVQGVGYRNWTYKKAIEHGLSGIVKNQMDGSVYIEIKGEEKQVDAFIRSCYHGPLLSNVKQIIVNDEAVLHYDDFKITRI